MSGELKPDIKAFLAYELSSVGQKVISEQGFYAISDKQKATNNTLLGIKSEAKELKKTKVK